MKFLVPGCEESETVTWDPQRFGFPVSELEARGRGKLQYKALHYSLQMQLREVGTKYWIKAWYKSKTQIRAVLSEATERQALFQSQEISHNLSESHELGSGIRSEEDLSDDHDLPMGSQKLSQQGSGPFQHIAEPTAADAITKQKKPQDNVLSPSTTTIFQPPSSVSYPANLEGDSIPATSGRSTLPSNPRKRRGSTEGARQPFREFSKSPMNIRPTQRQSIESNSEYSLGAPRNNGGKRYTACSKSMFLLTCAQAAGLAHSEISNANRESQNAHSAQGSGLFVNMVAQSGGTMKS
jgi:hypothetical protein